MTPKNLASAVAPSLVVAMLWGAVAGYPTMRANSEAEDRLDAAALESSTLLRSLQEIQGLPDSQEETVERTRQIEVAIPSQLELGTMLQTLDAAGDSHGVTVENFSPIQINDNASSPAETQMPDGISSVSFSLTAQGTYEGILDFFKALENLDRLVILDSVDVFTDTEDSVILTTEVKLRIFTSGVITEFEATNRSQAGALALNEAPTGQTEEDLDSEGLAPIGGTGETDISSLQLPPGLTEVELSEFLESVGTGQ